MTARIPLWLLYAQLAQHRDELIDELLDDNGHPAPDRAGVADNLAHLDNALEELRPVLPGYARVALEILRHKPYARRDRGTFPKNSGEIPPH